MCRSIKTRMVVNQATNSKMREEKNHYHRQLYPKDVNITNRNAKCIEEQKRNSRIGNPDRNEVVYSNEEKDRNSVSSRLFMLEKNFDSIMNNTNRLEKKLDSIINNMNYK